MESWFNVKNFVEQLFASTFFVFSCITPDMNAYAHQGNPIFSTFQSTTSGLCNQKILVASLLFYLRTPLSTVYKKTIFNKKNSNFRTNLLYSKVCGNEKVMVPQVQSPLHAQATGCRFESWENRFTLVLILTKFCITSLTIKQNFSHYVV